MADLDLEAIRQRARRDLRSGDSNLEIVDDALKLADEVERLEAALRHAVKVIQSYESDIRNSDWLGINIVEAGFCQGSIYADAEQDIQRIRNGEAS